MLDNIVEVASALFLISITSLGTVGACALIFIIVRSVLR